MPTQIELRGIGAEAGMPFEKTRLLAAKVVDDRQPRPREAPEVREPGHLERHRLAADAEPDDDEMCDGVGRLAPQ